MIELWAEAGKCGKSIDTALKYVDAIHGAGAAALKVQWYNPDTVFVPSAPRYDNTSGPALTQYAAEANPIYPYSLWAPVIERCKELNIKFIPSVFDFEAVDAAAEFGLSTIKIASGDITYHALIERAVAATPNGGQVALSTGASTFDEIEVAANLLRSGDILMACHLEYPTPYHRANVARTFTLQAHFPHLVPGFSDHTPGVDTIPIIVATGCQYIEKHFTLQQGQGYDSDFALSPTDLRNAQLKIEGTVAVMGSSDLEPDSDELPAREGARRSLYAAHDIPAGHVITQHDLIALRPDYGVPPQMLSRYVGRSFETDIPKHGQLPT